MKKLLQLTFIMFWFSFPSLAQNWEDSARTFTRNDAGAWGPGVKSGFYQTQSPVNFPSGASGWWHLLDIRQNNSSINYAMQFAGSLFDQNLYYRKTNGDGSTAWSRVLMESGSSTLDDDTMRMSFSKFAGGGWMNLPTTGPSGIGSGGPGKNAWIGYIHQNGQWIANGLAQDIAYRNTQGRLLFGNYADSAAAMTIDHNRVGIGTSQTNDPNYRLFVDKGIRTRKIRVDQSTWADYVFAPDYRLPSLAEVEQYIQQNKHLPDVPSAREVDKEGIDLGSSQATLLRKIEELMLYVIEQNKKLQEQGKQVTEQQEQIDKLKKQVSMLGK